MTAPLYCLIAVAATALGLTTGCTSVRRIARPPSAGEIDELNRSVSGEPGTFSVVYFDSLHPCAGGTCAAVGRRPVVDAPPFEIKRIVFATEADMTVVAQNDDVWRLDVSKVAGVTTRHRATFAGGVAGAAFGLAVGGMIAIAASAPWADSSASSQSQGASSGARVGLLATSTIIGAIVGAALGHTIFRRDSVEFGDTGISSDPASKLGR